MNRGSLARDVILREAKDLVEPWYLQLEHRFFAGPQDDKVGDGSHVMKYSDHVCARYPDFLYLI